MTLSALRPDALRSRGDGFTLLLGLPWIRSMPLAGLQDLTVTIDGTPIRTLSIDIDGRRVEPSSLSAEEGWWFLQDRLAIRGDLAVPGGAHDVAVTFRLVIPYLPMGPDAPLILPFDIRTSLWVDAAPAAPSPGLVAEPAVPVRALPARALPEAWTLAASAFNWTPEVIRAERPAPEIALGIIEQGVSSVIEIEPGQLWRSYPQPADTEVEAFGDALSSVGGSVSIVGASLDDWLSPTRRRDDAERFAFLLPQLRAAQLVGAAGVRLPIGQAGEPLLRRLLPVLHDLDLILYEEIQGQQTPDSAGAAPAIEAIARLDDAHVRVLVDISMLMPSLPPSYLELLRRGGVAEPLLRRLATEWSDPATNSAVMEALRSGAVPPEVHTAFMNLIVRFGRSRASDLRGILPLAGAIHLKFWDLDDSDARISGPISDIAAELSRVGFTGTLCSEWGGHEWLDDDPTEITARHLELAHRALIA